MRVLIIDDDAIFCGMMADLTETLGHEPLCRHNLKDGLAAAADGGCDVVILDVNLPDGHGLDILPQIRVRADSPEVIIITGLGDAAGAAMAIKWGAWDYILKNAGLDRTTLTLRRAIEHRRRKLERHRLRVLNREDIVGVSASIQACLDRVAQAAETDFNVLITGETGTGKELFARAIHRNSARASREMIVVDCASLAETVVESILFGHEKGAFTGAQTTRPGLIKMADGGTLFLDEVGELPLTVQKSFLRVLQEKRFRPVGGPREVASDFRLVAATNQNLDRLVDEGRFRQDLLFRLRSLTIHLPPLRERPEDIDELAMHVLLRLSRSKSLGSKGLSPEFLAALAGHHWPGNVRELVNVLEAVFAAGLDEPILLPQHLPADLRIAWAQKSLRPAVSTGTAENRIPETSEAGFPDIRNYRQEMEFRYLKELMLKAQGDRSRASVMAGLSLSRLYVLLKAHGLD